MASINSINKPPLYPEYKGQHEKKEKKEKQINSETDHKSENLTKKNNISDIVDTDTEKMRGGNQMKVLINTKNSITDKTSKKYTELTKEINEIIGQIGDMKKMRLFQMDKKA